MQKHWCEATVCKSRARVTDAPAPEARPRADMAAGRARKNYKAAALITRSSSYPSLGGVKDSSQKPLCIESVIVAMMDVGEMSVHMRGVRMLVRVAMRLDAVPRIMLVPMVQVMHVAMGMMHRVMDMLMLMLFA